MRPAILLSVAGGWSLSTIVGQNAKAWSNCDGRHPNIVVFLYDAEEVQTVADLRLMNPAIKDEEMDEHSGDVDESYTKAPRELLNYKNNEFYIDTQLIDFDLLIILPRSRIQCVVNVTLGQCKGI
jgi:hypothetical protein